MQRKNLKNMTQTIDIKPESRAEWEHAVKHHAERIRGMISRQVFGWNITDNKDALIVAVYLKGVEEGRKNSELILGQMIAKIKMEEDKKNNVSGVLDTKS
jgi:cytochrome c